MKKHWWVFVFLAAVPLSQTIAQPSLPPNAIVNGASFAAATALNGALAPGAIVSAFGSNLASGTQLALSVPLSTTIAGSSLAFTAGSVTYPAPLFFVAASQINAQVPFDVPVGAAVTAQITFNGQKSAAQSVTMAAVSPGIFFHTDGSGALLHNDTFDFVDSTNPAKRGEFIDIFCTGLGAVDKTVASGTIGPNPAANTIAKPAVTVAGQAASVVFSGLAPGFVGLYQVAFQVPNVTGGNQDVIMSVNGLQSNTVKMAVAP